MIDYMIAAVMIKVSLRLRTRTKYVSEHNLFSMRIEHMEKKDNRMLASSGEYNIAQMKHVSVRGIALKTIGKLNVLTHDKTGVLFFYNHLLQIHNCLRVLSHRAR